MTLGLTGAQRTGKTTLADAFAKAQNMPLVRTSATEVFAILGKDPKVEYPIGERIAIQESILLAFEGLYSKAGKTAPVWVADRTPLDLAGYMLADVQRSTLADQPEVARMVNGYVQRCLEATNRWFSTVVLVQPGIALVEEAGKAPACPAFIEHFNTLQLGFLVDPRLKVTSYVIPRRYTDLQDRMDSISKAVENNLDKAQRQRATLESAGVPMQ